VGNLWLPSLESHSLQYKDGLCMCTSAVVLSLLTLVLSEYSSVMHVESCDAVNVMRGRSLGQADNMKILFKGITQPSRLVVVECDNIRLVSI
jgi:hypothetical protein